MNNWHDEYMAEFNRQRILEEVEHIRLEKIALQSRPYRPRFFQRTMFNFANWMISTGKQLRKRYDAPAANCQHAPASGFAH